jgi:lipopolysaccharide/colanic/teichoic acid biosynthesis glycosyltransferase
MLATAADPERLYVREIVPAKIRLNLAYAARATVWTDLRVMLATVRQVFWSPGGRHDATASDPADG